MLQPKKSNKKPSPTKKYKAQDSTLEDVFEIFDPTGISSYDDVYRSYKENGLLSWQTALEGLGALPVIGKVGKGIKAINTTNKYLKALNKINKTVEKSEKVVPKLLKFGKEFGIIAQKVSRGGRANPIAAASIGVGMGAEALQKLTKIIEKGTGKGVEKIVSKLPAKKQAIETAAQTLNTVNTLSDTQGAIQNQIIDPLTRKTVYYNTDPKRGKVEQPGKEKNVQYVPISNSAELKMWETQKSTPVSSNLKTKVLRTALGAVMPDQAAQFLSAIATKDNKLGVDDLSPDVKEALIASIKNAQKRTGKSSGGTQYVDFGPEVDEAFQGMKAGPGKMLSTDPATQAAAMVGRVSYKKNAKGETEIYDSYDFSKTNPDKADSLYKKIRAYAGEVLPDEGNQPNLIGVIPNKQEELAYGTNQNGIMKKSMNPRKKYLNGSNSGGVTPNGIPTPASTLNDYNIMMAQAEQEAASNEWLPVAGIIGGLAQSAISFGAQGGFNKTPAVPGAKAANGMNNVNADVEVEGGEMYETPQGNTGEFQGPSHEQGGIPMEVNQDIPEGTKVYSDRLTVGKETLAERKAKREKQIANLEKMASQPLVDTAIKNATKRKMEAIQREEMADLQYQEQVNNMQQMADTVVAAFGTSMEGLQKNTMEYGMGTGASGVMEYADGTDENGIVGPMNKPKAPMYMKQLLPTPTPNLLNNFDINYTPSDFNIEGLMEGETPFVPATGVMAGLEKTYQDNKAAAKKANNPDGNMLTRGLEKMSIPGVGDLTGLFGDYLGVTSGLKNANESRATDVTHQNVYANVGKDSQKYLDNAMANVEGMKAQAEMKATTTTRGSKISVNNSARGVNQKRGMNWLYDQGLADSLSSISANAANQVSDLFKAKSSTAMSVDQLKGEGQFKANMANEAAKDAYYNAKGLALKDQSLAVQQAGKDINAIKQNKMIENLMKQYGTYVTPDMQTGAISNKTIPGQKQQVFTLGGKKYTTDSEGNLKLV
jgi:uncharacterized protein YjgD (DUF1641 family)